MSDPITTEASNPITTESGNTLTTEITMPSSTPIAIGATKRLIITPTPANTDLSAITYRADPAASVTLAPGHAALPAGGPSGIQYYVDVTRLAAGTVKIFADTPGVDASGNPITLEAEGDAVDPVPLPQSIAAAWAS